MAKELEEAPPPKKRKGPPLPIKIFQIIISLIIFALLGVGLYLSFRSFTGMDPLTISPTSVSKNFLNSEKAFNLINKFFSFNPAEGLKSKDTSSDNSINPQNSPTKFKFAIIADSHKDIEN